MTPAPRVLPAAARASAALSPALALDHSLTWRGHRANGGRECCRHAAAGLGYVISKPGAEGASTAAGGTVPGLPGTFAAQTAVSSSLVAWDLTKADVASTVGFEPLWYRRPEPVPTGQSYPWLTRRGSRSYTPGAWLRFRLTRQCGQPDNITGSSCGRCGLPCHPPFGSAVARAGKLVSAGVGAGCGRTATSSRCGPGTRNIFAG